jgi:hypothetical protein
VEALGPSAPDHRGGELLKLLASLRALIREEVREELRAAKSAEPQGRIRHDRTGLERKKVLCAIRSGELAAAKVGKFYYLEPSALEAYFAAHKSTGEAPPADDFAAAMQRSGLRRGKAKVSR